MLGRVIRLTHERITWQGDPRHNNLLQEYFGMDDKTKVLTKNGYENGPEQVEPRETELSIEEYKAFRMVAARLNYMAQDNPWLQFPAKEVCRNMAKSRASNFMKTKRLVRFLKGSGEIKFLYAWQNEDEDEACDITVFVDSDWAGNTETRKSTSGGVLKVGKHVIRTWSLTQTTVATSSGEAELIAMHDGVTRELVMRTMMTEIGLSPQLKMVRISTDSSVAKSFVATRGLGKMWHLEVKFLWLQEIVQMSKVRVEKVSGATNIADALTKYHGIDKLDALCRPHGIVNWRCLLGTESGPDGKNRRAEERCDENPTSGRAEGSAQTLGHDTCGG